jgi:hypothetical protein
MKLRFLLLQAVFAVASATTAVAAFAQIVVVAPNAPPPARYEPVPTARIGYVWDRGHWLWDYGRYVWRPGHWQVERAGYHWQLGHWVASGPTWHWVPAHWA